MKDYKILALSDSLLLPTGYANQSREILKRFAQEPEFEVKVIGAQYNGMPMHVNFDNFMLDAKDTRNVPQILSNGRQAYGQDILMPYLNFEKPDVFWCLLDLFMVNYLKGIDIKPAKFVMYYPSDGFPLPWGSEDVLRKATVAVSMSKYGRDQAIDLGVDARYIPHATDPRKFYPLPAEIKKKLRLSWSNRLHFPLEDKFIVGFVGRNQGRKMVDRLLVAFAKFAKKCPKVVLLLHTDPFDMAAVVNLVDFSQRLGIRDRVVYTGATVDFAFSERELLEVYNLFDVSASSTSGEGFGICTIESMACEVPMVITDYTTTKEIVTDNNAGIAVPVQSYLTGTWNVDRAIVDVDKMAEAFEFLYNNPDLRVQMGKNGRAAVLRDFTWDKVYPQWKKLMLEVLEK